jgi:hypothetical protein
VLGRNEEKKIKRKTRERPAGQGVGLHQENWVGPHKVKRKEKVGCARGKLMGRIQRTVLFFILFFNGLNFMDMV